MVNVTIERAAHRDLPALLELLRDQDLPVDGLEQHLLTTLVAHSNGRAVGIVAVEVYPDGGLLRSVAVAKTLEGQGLGRTLTDAAVSMAREAGLEVLYLLTTTAEYYFPKFGFERVRREDVPASVRTSVEFTTACPSTAVVMRRRV
jgi:amino-acid N-acetyltransferase